MVIGGLKWDETASRYYYTGIDGVALFVYDETSGWFKNPVAWNGVTAINESPSGAESNKQYADSIEYLNLVSKEEFSLTLEAFQVPKEFSPCDGVTLKANNAMMFHGQPRKMFALVYRVKKGSDTVEAGGKVGGSSNGDGYIYHVVYGCRSTPSSRDFGTVNDSPEAVSFSYEISTSPITDTTKFPTGSGLTEVAHVEIDASKLSSTKARALENLLYPSSTGSLATPKQIAETLA